MKQNKKTIIFLSFIIILLLLPTLYAGPIKQVSLSDGRTGLIQYTYFTFFTAGAVISIVAYYLKAIKQCWLSSAAIFYTVPSFIAVFFIGQSVRPIIPPYLFEQIGILSLFTRRGMRIPESIKSNSSTLKISKFIPVFGYLTEFVCGILVVIMIIVLIKAIRNHKIKELLQFKLAYLLFLLLPIILGFIDFFSHILFIKMHEITMIKTNTDSIWFQTVHMWILFISALLVVILIFENIYIKRWASILGIILSILTWLFWLYGTALLNKQGISINIINKIYNSNAILMFTILCGGLSGFSIQTFKKRQTE